MEPENILGIHDLRNVAALRNGMIEKAAVAERLTGPNLRLPPRIAFEVVGLEVPEYPDDNVSSFNPNSQVDPATDPSGMQNPEPIPSDSHIPPPRDPRSPASTTDTQQQTSLGGEGKVKSQGEIREERKAKEISEIREKVSEMREKRANELENEKKILISSFFSSYGRFLGKEVGVKKKFEVFFGRFRDEIISSTSKDLGFEVFLSDFERLFARFDEIFLKELRKDKTPSRRDFEILILASISKARREIFSASGAQKFLWLTPKSEKGNRIHKSYGESGSKDSEYSYIKDNSSNPFSNNSPRLRYPLDTKAMNKLALTKCFCSEVPV